MQRGFDARDAKDATVVGSSPSAAEQARLAAAEACPICGRGDALLAIGDVLYCAACGYASDSARGCT